MLNPVEGMIQSHIYKITDNMIIYKIADNVSVLEDFEECKYTLEEVKRMNEIKEIKKMMDTITTKIFRGERLTKEDMTFLKDLGSKTTSINLYVDEENDYEHIIILNFEDESMEIPMDYTWWHCIVVMICFMGIDKLDPKSADIASISSVIEGLLTYPEELVDLIDWYSWVYHEDVEIHLYRETLDVYGLIDKCVEHGYSEITMALLRYVHELTGHGVSNQNQMRL